ncbi:MAG: helicase C-terminal domain-containing protein, partial [Chloroflexota bacterium]|nr:helicase C-terminal domain-containing protein [Chloroflexota bacterium]
MLPSHGRYGLQALAQSLGVPVQAAHRAIDDAHTTRQVFLQLYEEARAIPFPILEEITRYGEEIEWGAGWVFDLAYGERREKEEPAKGEFPTLFPKALIPEERLTPSVEPEPLDVEEIASIFEPGGSMARAFPGYEDRPQQISMVRAVTEALSESKHLLVEAGTGTGKSMAYLAPAFAWATQNGQPVVISTNTLNLQDQLIHKDIPDLNQALGAEYQAAVLKGRGNYLCPRRFNTLRSLGPRSSEETRVLTKLLLWLTNGGSGDRSELNLPREESVIWARLSADNEDCSLENCLQHAGGTCPYYRARLAAEHAHVIIVNHALLLADIAIGNRVIPEYQHLIIDEAHHLESATTNGLSYSVTELEVQRVLRDLGSRTRGLLRQIFEVARASLPPEGSTQVDRVISAVSDRTVECIEMSKTLFGHISEVLENQREGRELGFYGQQMRIVPATRTLPDWEKVEISWENLRGPLAKIVEKLAEMADDLESLAETGVDAAENLSVAARIARRSLGEVYKHLERMIFEPDPADIYWANVRPPGERLSLHAAPLEVGPLVERYLWHEKEAVIMTSATLTTAGDFDYIRRRLYAQDADELALGSPFDHESSTMLYLVNDIPEPVQRQAYQRALESGLIRLVKEIGGQTMVLFTSNAQLQATARALAEPLTSEGIHLFEQSRGASRHALLESFRSTEQAVLLGTRSFWEGVDIPGPALSVLGIVRLPFAVPNDPIIAARADTYESPFDEYMLPEAILRFRQGFGRLIRTRSDRGVVVVFDRRIISKFYGRFFVDSLPRCSVKLGTLAELPEAATRWLGL